MTAVETVKAKVSRITSNKGHVRLYLVVSVVWILATTWLVWGPLPSAAGTTSQFGLPSVTGCEDVVLDYAQCEAQANSEAAGLALIERAAVVFFLPIILPLLILFGKFVLEWIGDGYGKKSEPPV